MNINYNNTSSFQMNCFLNIKFKVFKLFEKLIENKNEYNNKKLLNFKILDIGCSYGWNSNLQINEFINQIKSNKLIVEKLKKEKEELKIQIYHSDLPENDFTKLFKLLYNNNENDEISYGIGHSFNNQIMLNESCDFIFSFFTFHWIESNEKYYSFDRSMISARYESRLPGNENCKERLENIFTNRLNELKKGGIFICTFCQLHNEFDLNNYGSLERSFNNIKDILREMHFEGLLEKDEVSKMVIPTCSPRKDECEFAIKQVESKGLKLIEKSNEIVNWVQQACKNKSFNNLDEEYQFSIDSILSFSGGFIYSSIHGEKSSKDLIYNQFKSRLFKKYKESPKSFEFFINVLYLSFEKQ